MTTHAHEHKHSHPHADKEEETAILRIQRLAMFLEAHFGEVELHMPDAPSEEEGNDEDAPGLLVAVDETEAFISLATMVS